MFGSAEQKERWLSPLLDGTIRSAFAMTEPDVASSDATNIETSIVRDGDEYVVNGRKWWITGAMNPQCEIFIVMGKTDPSAERHRQQSMVLVPRDTPGLTVVRPMTVFGYDDHEHGGHAELRFEDVRVPADNLIADEGLGFAIAQARLGPGRIHHCMRAIGLAERAIELMCDRVEERVAFGKPLARPGRHPRLDRRGPGRGRAAAAAGAQDRLADGHRRQQGRAHRDPGDQDRHAQGRAGILDRAIQVHGAGGLSQDFPLAASYAAIRTLRFADGPDEVHKASLARAELARQARRPLMDLSLSEEQEAFRALARDFLEKEAVPHRTRVGPRRVGGPRDHPQDGRDRLLRADHPRGVRRPRRRLPHLLPGHGGARPRRLRGARDRLGLAGPGRQVHRSATAPRSRSSEWLPGICAGETLGCFGLTEPGTGSDAGNLATRADRDGDDWRPRRARRCSSPTAPGPTSRWSSPVPADRARGHHGVPRPDRHAPGFEAREIKGKLGLRGQATAELIFDDVRVPDAARLGEEGQGSRSPCRRWTKAGCRVAAGCVGIVQACLEARVAYASERTQFGKPIAGFQLVQQLIADIAARRPTRPGCWSGGSPT